MAFMKAGIDTGDVAAKYFVKGYDGELTVDAIKQAAAEARLLSPNVPVENLSEQQAWNRTNQVAAGASSANEIPDLQARLDAASSEAEVLAILSEVQN